MGPRVLSAEVLIRKLNFSNGRRIARGGRWNGGKAKGEGEIGGGIISTDENEDVYLTVIIPLLISLFDFPFRCLTSCSR